MLERKEIVTKLIGKSLSFPVIDNIKKTHHCTHLPHLIVDRDKSY